MAPRSRSIYTEAKLRRFPGPEFHCACISKEYHCERGHRTLWIAVRMRLKKYYHERSVASNKYLFKYCRAFHVPPLASFLRYLFVQR